MKLFHRKKAAMELSINAIVIVVLAFTLLGLGLVFIRTQFKNIGDTSSQVTEQVKQQILDDLRTGNKRLSFPVTELKLSANEDSLISIGVKNILSDPLYFKVDIVPILSSQAGGIYGPPTYKPNKPITTPDASTDGAFFWDNNVQTLPVGESQVYGIKYRADKGGNTYQYKIVITQVTTKTVNGVLVEDTTVPRIEYSARSFFVKIS